MSADHTRVVGCVAALFVLLDAVSTPAQLGRPRNDDARRLLRLTTRVVGERYCRTSDPTIDVLLLELALEFTDVGMRPIILPRDSPIVPCMMLGRSAAELYEQRYEAHWCNDVVIARNDSVPALDTPDEHFVVLRPGESYTTSAEITVLVSQAEPARRAPEQLGPDEHVGCYDITITIGPPLPPEASGSRSATAPPCGCDRNCAVATEVPTGRHFLSVYALTWSPAYPPNYFQDKWKPVGEIWPYGVNSEPMPFDVAGPGRSADCT